jgi:Septum formation
VASTTPAEDGTFAAISPTNMTRRSTVAVALVFVCGACSNGDDLSDGPLPAASLADEGEATSVFDLDIGQCYNTPAETDVDEVNTVECDEPHQYEIYALPQHPAGPDEDYPGDEEISDFADDECLGDTFERYVGVSYESSELLAFVLQPTEETWEAADDREFVCAVYLESGELEGSVAGSER